MASIWQLILPAAFIVMGTAAWSEEPTPVKDVPELPIKEEPPKPPTVITIDPDYPFPPGHQRKEIIEEIRKLRTDKARQQEARLMRKPLDLFSAKSDILLHHNKFDTFDSLKRELQQK